MADTRQGSDRVSDVQVRLMRYFEGKQPGRTIYLADLEHELRESKEVLQKGVNNLRKRTEWGAALEIVIRGQAWKIKDLPAADGEQGDNLMFQQVAVLRDGALLVECEDGRLGKVTWLDYSTKKE